MVVRINTGAKPAGAILYNEHKVAHGEARFLGLVNAAAFDENTLRLSDKILVLDAFTKLNERISKPTFHASLAFHPSEPMSDDLMKTIGQQYMDRLGYGDQPYLVYRHEDTNHPHIHIVSVSIDHDGKKISDSHQQRRSNAIRQALEKEYNLIEAEKQGKEVLMSGLLPEQVLNYKVPEAKKAIGNVVRTALTDYNFSNIQTFSEFLHQHRVQMNQLSGMTADGNSYRGVTFQLHNGQNDKRGEAIGPAIKASRFSFAPTHERLETKFKQNATRIHNGKEATRQRIHSSLATYSQLSEADFKAQLRRAGIQVIDTGQQYVYVDHKSRNVYAEQELGSAYTRQVQQAAFSERSVSLDAPQSRVRATQTHTGQKPQTTRTAESAKWSEKLAPAPEPTAQEIALRRRVSHFYQRVRQQGVAGQKPHFFESQLIRQFPYESLTNLVVGEGADSQVARQAVTKFEAYKQSQLPEIRAKEEAYFSQTASQFASLASRLPLSATSKQAFLAAADLILTVDRGTLTHREDAQLRYTIPVTVQSQLQQDQGPTLAFRERLSKPERILYGALAGGQMPPESVSFYQISAAHLKAATGPIFDHVSLALNKSYTSQVGQHLSNKKTLLAQLQARGIVIEALASGTYRMGHYLTHSNQFIPVPDLLSRQLQNESLPLLTKQTELLHTPVGRRLVSISQALDGNNTALLQGELMRWQRQTNHSLGAGSIVDQALGVQTQLQALLAAPAPSKGESVVNKVINSTSQIATTQPDSIVSKGLVDLLGQANLTAQQRYQLITQMGLVWQRTAGGQVRLKEGERSTNPGLVYQLTPTEQTLFNRPNDKESVSLRLNAADQVLLRIIAQGPELTGLTRQQIASLTLPVVENLLPKEMIPTFQRWYNEQRGNQILVDTQRQFGEQASPRRHLSALYQRGFLVKQDVDASNKPVYRIGHFKAHPASYVAVPSEIARDFSHQFPTEYQKNAYVLEGAWPAPNSIAAQRMRSLARAIDSEMETGRVIKQIERIHERFPQLTGVQNLQLLLDKLVSQPRMIHQSFGGSTLSPQPTLANPQYYENSGRLSSQRTSSSNDHLETLLEKLENQPPQKGLLDILGESASAIRPKKKRVGADAPFRRRSRKR